jgi:hypothetical protein
VEQKRRFLANLLLLSRKKPGASCRLTKRQKRKKAGTLLVFQLSLSELMKELFLFLELCT